MLKGMAALAVSLLAASNAWAVGVPEIDGGSAALAVGLAIGMVALVREWRRR